MQARVVAEPEVTAPDLGHLRVDLDTVDLHIRVELPERPGRRPARVSDHEHPLGRVVEKGRDDEEHVPLPAREHGVRPPHRVIDDALVETEDTRAVGALQHLDVLVGRLRLVDEARRRLDRLCGDEEERGHPDGEDLPAAAEHERGREDEQGRGAEHRPLRSDERDGDERRDEGADDAPERGEGVEASGDRARLGDVVEGEANGERRDGAQERHRHREQKECGEEGADDGADADRVETLHGEVEDRPRYEREHRDDERGHEHDPPEQAGLGPAVGHLASDPVADREVDEDQPDDVGPDDRRAAEVGREEPRGGDLGRQGSRARGEDDDSEPPAAHRGDGHGRGRQGLSLRHTTAQSSESSPPAKLLQSASTASASSCAPSSARRRNRSSSRSSP